MHSTLPIPIQQCSVGSFVQIVSVEGRGGAARRALELGLVAGAVCRVIRKAPFGGPLEIEVGNTRIGIRPADDLRVLVRIPTDVADDVQTGVADDVPMNVAADAIAA